jgi:hypothetical protein
VGRDAAASDISVRKRAPARRGSAHAGQPLKCLLYDISARVLGARARQNAQARSDLLDPGFRQATEEVFPRHTADVGVGAEGVDRDALDTPAVGWEEAEAFFFGAARR